MRYEKALIFKGTFCRNQSSLLSKVSRPSYSAFTHNAYQSAHQFISSTQKIF
jgi:hypothetical protein